MIYSNYVISLQNGLTALHLSSKEGHAGVVTDLLNRRRYHRKSS